MKKAILLSITSIVVALMMSAWVTSGRTPDNNNQIKEIKIGNQIWMAQNLDVAVFRNGDPIPQARTRKEWNEAGMKRQPAWCYYNNDSVTGARYGKIYNYFAVNDPRGLAPEGWHIPTGNEWMAMRDYLGGKKTAGGKLKSKEGWHNNHNGSNETGFNALPGGSREITLLTRNIGFQGAGKFTYWWTSNKADRFQVQAFGVTSGNDVLYNIFCDLDEGLYVRCVKN
ncbi:MAG: fibrobacter succinogenes major paralogous domain-containing protein [Bacteroidia bacterium]